VYAQRIEYTTLPADDAALVEWLRAQPGVSGAAVSREGRVLVVSFSMRTMGSAPGPDVIAEAERFGYQGRGSFSGSLRGNR
jgi:hypothetical protein